MWNEIVKHLGKFPSAVLTGIDADGYPFSLRCTPQLDDSRKVLLIARSGAALIQTGPAGLLCHSHNDQLWEIKSIQILGRLEQAGQNWVLHPERFIPGGGIQGQISQMQILWKARSDAKKYLQKRGLPWPKVRWEGFQATKAEARQPEGDR